MAIVRLAGVGVRSSSPVPPVRLTNSGLGCDDWPQVLEHQARRRVVETRRDRATQPVVHRRRRRGGDRRRARIVGGGVPRRRDLTVLSWWLVFGVLANAVLGGISVKVDLHPLAIQGHMLLSLLLIVVATSWCAGPASPTASARQATVARGYPHAGDTAVRVTWVAASTGTLVTGAGPHAGDETAPAARRRDSRRWRACTASSVVAAIAVSLWIAVRIGATWRRTRGARRSR